MPSDRDASISDAAFREALDAWEYEVGMRATGRVDLEMYHKARDRVLALHAERQGEEYEVRRIWVTSRADRMEQQDVVFLNGVKPGDKVRVTKVEEE